MEKGSILTKGSLGLVAIIIVGCLYFFASGDREIETSVPKREIDSTDEIARLLRDRPEELPELNFPARTAQVYAKQNYKLVWLSNPKLYASALNLLQSVSRFGLKPSDFHAGWMNEETGDTSKSGKLIPAYISAKKDIFLTDAVLTLIWQLHFGKYNPRYRLSQLDDSTFVGFKVDSVLQRAIDAQKLEQEILLAQPRDSVYRRLQGYLEHAIDKKPNFSETDREEWRLIAINLERCRWYPAEGTISVDINIPAFNLAFRHPGGEDLYRVIVGKPSTPTPSLHSNIRFLTTAPDWNVPAGIFRKEVLPRALSRPAYLAENNMAIYDRKGRIISPTDQNLQFVRRNPSDYLARQSPGCDNALGRIVFNFSNPYSVYLHDTPNHLLFNERHRAFSHGCIRLDNPEKFVSVLLKTLSAPPEVHKSVIRAMDRYERFRYDLPTPVPISIRYLTCTMETGKLIRYPDIYGKDKRLIAAFFEAESIKQVE